MESLQKGKILFHLGEAMRFEFVNYQLKGKPYLDALIQAGFEHTRENPELLFIDRERYMTNNTVARNQVLRYPGVPVMTYPHCALPPWWYDGLVPMPDYIKRVFVIGNGQKRAMKIIAPGAKVETTGWPWCKVLPFKANEISNILFAPIHSTGGRLRPEGIEANQKIMAALRKLDKTRYKVTVRFIESRIRQGVSREPTFKWIKGVTDNSTDDIDKADLVIAEGTMMYLAVARGKPVIGINQHLPMRPNMKEGYNPHNWDKYGPGIAYPVNFGDAPLVELFDRAMVEQTKWKRDFIGDEFDPVKFAKKVEHAWKKDS
jgi:hypothetical protein